METEELEENLMKFYPRFLSESKNMKISDNIFLSLETPSFNLQNFTSYTKKKG